MEPAVKLFLSYSHKDKERKDEFLPYLQLLSKECNVSIWVDTMINGGDDWDKSIVKNLETSQVIVLLISPDFMLSQFCTTREMSVALDKHRNHQAIVLPILVRPLAEGKYEFNSIQTLPQADAAGLRAVSTWGEKRDEAWLRVVEGIKLAIQPILQDCQRYDIDARAQIIFTHVEQDNITQALKDLMDFCEQFAVDNDECIDEAMACKMNYESLKRQAEADIEQKEQLRHQTLKRVLKLIRNVRKTPVPQQAA